MRNWSFLPVTWISDMLVRSAVDLKARATGCHVAFDGNTSYARLDLTPVTVTCGAVLFLTCVHQSQDMN